MSIVRSADQASASQPLAERGPLRSGLARSLFARHPWPVLLVDGGFRLVVAANPAACRRYGLPASTPFPLPLRQLWPDAMAPDRGAGGSHRLGRAVHRHADGSSLPGSLDIDPADDDGTAYWMLTLHAELALPALRPADPLSAYTGHPGALLEVASRALQLGGWAMDLASKRIVWSQEVAAIHAMPSDFQPDLDSGIDFYVPEHRGLIADAVQRCALEGVPYDLELKIVTAMGDTRWVRTIGLPRHDGEGRIIAIHGAFLDIHERKETELLLKRSEAALRAARERMEAVLSAVPDLWFVLDSEGRYREVSDPDHPSMTTRWHEAYGRHFAMVVPPDVGRLAMETLTRAQASGQVEVMRYQLEIKDGRWRTFEARIAPMSNGQWLYITRDITDQQRAQAELAESEARYARVVRGTSDGVWEFTPGTSENYLSPRWKGLLGYADHELANHSDTFFDLLHPDDRPRVEMATQAHLDGWAPYDVEMRLRTRDGTYRWFRSRGQAERDPAGRPVRMSGATTDITEQRAATQERQRLAERLRLAASAGGIGTWEAVPAFHQLEWDDQTRLLFGGSADVATPPMMLYQAAVERPERQRIRRWLRDLFVSGLAPSIEFEVRPPGAEPRWLAAKGTVVRDDAGRPRSMIGVAWDVTEQRRTHARLLDYQNRLSDLTHRLLVQEKLTAMHLAQALHDQIGQTLAAIRYSPEFLQLDEQQQSQPPEARRATPLIGLLDEAISEVRQVLVDLRPPFLHEHGLAAALDNELRTRLPTRRSVDRLLDVDAGLADTRWPGAVEFAMFMIAREAVSNSLKHAEATVVQVSVNGAADWLRLEVTDDGRGIAAEAMAPLPGHLGLVGMRERALAIGAALDIQSTPGQGTTVSVRWSCQPTGGAGADRDGP